MRTLPLRFVTPWLLALIVGCGSSSGEGGSTTPPTQSAAASTSGGAAATTPVVPSTETVAATATPAETTPVVATTPAATPATTPAATPATTPATTPAATPAAAPADAATIARGHRAFTRACGNCHEENDPEGPSPNKNWEEARMRSQVRQGAGRMRAIAPARLSDADLDAMIAFFRSTHAVR